MTEVLESKTKALAEKELEEIRVRKRTLEAVLQQCQRALESLKVVDDPANPGGAMEEEEEEDGEEEGSSYFTDSETAELCDLLKSRVESPDFLEKLGSIHMPVAHNVSEEGFCWDVISETDLWGELVNEDNGSDGDGYVVVKQEDIVEGVACFMAAYLLSLKETRELTPNQLQEGSLLLLDVPMNASSLSTTFSGKKKKGKLRKVWNGTKVIYNVASWGATAIGIYQNPALFRAASVAFWTSCRVISKLI
ncbi:hypothetical protein EJ110_NYTH24242 [Nymphaea thermarum]|nr:hypothetical protein EJ110_NYTH24242 [Nymphaea thermarum]